LNVLSELSPYWVGANILQAVWGPLFGKRFMGMSTIVLAGLSLCLGKCYTMMESNVDLPHPSLSILPISMHSTWVSIATLLNFSIFLMQKGAGPKTRLVTAYVSLVTAFVYPASMTFRYCDPIPSLVSAWALYAISKKDNNPKELGFKSNDVSRVKNVSKSLSIISFTAAVITFLYNFAS